MSEDIAQSQDPRDLAAESAQIGAEQPNSAFSAGAVPGSPQSQASEPSFQPASPSVETPRFSPQSAYSPASALAEEPRQETAPAGPIGEGNIVQGVADAITAEVHKAVVGQDEVIQSALAGLFADGHVLLEGVPGTAKTLLVRALAASVSADFGRIQFTPDLMPSDITGTRIYDMQSGEFRVKTGPIFTGLLLADEINRTPPKTQAALLEAMQERRVTIDGEPYDLPALFMVFATQNPVEFEGTYPLPEAQLDRFLLKVVIGYPSQEDEQSILRRYHQGFDANDLSTAGIQPVADAASIERCRAIIGGVRVEDALFRYITLLITATRDHRHLVLGASPRAAIALLQVSKAMAAMQGRDYIIPDDIKAIAPAVLRHRLVLRPEAEIEGISADNIIMGILDQLEVPR